MKTATVPCRGPLSHGLSLFAALVCAWSTLGSGSVAAESVDSEILLLVDASNGGLRRGEFTSLMEGYATAMTSDAVITAISSGRIAVSLSFYGVRNAGESVGVDWMSIGGIEEAQAFAAQLRTLSQPRGGNYSYQDALVQGLADIGDEVGGVDNGFQSAVQIIQVAGSTRPRGRAGNVAAASSAAMNNGVDLINAAVVGRRANQLESYYSDNIIGGSVGGVAATVTNSPINGELASVLSGQISQSIAGGQITAVPEPSAATLIISSIGGFLLFARRRVA